MIKSKVVLNTSVVALALGFSVSQSQADVAISYSNPLNKETDMVMTVTGDRAAMEMPGDGGEPMRVVYDKIKNKIFMVMDNQRQYMDMDTMMETMSGLAGMLSGMMKDLPEDTQGQLGGLLGGLTGQQPAAPAMEPKMTATGQWDNVNGINCQVSTYETSDGKVEMCLAEPAAAGISASDFTVIQGMMAKQKESAKQAGEMLGMNNLDMMPGAIDQIPLRVRQLSGADAGTVSEIKKTSDVVDKTKVEIPSDYQIMQLGG